MVSVGNTEAVFPLVSSLVMAATAMADAAASASQISMPEDDGVLSFSKYKEVLFSPQGGITEEDVTAPDNRSKREAYHYLHVKKSHSKGDNQGCL